MAMSMKPGDQVIVKLWSGEEIVGKLVREEYLTSGERVVVESGDRVIMIAKSRCRPHDED
jgi:hypothetical protein